MHESQRQMPVYEGHQSSHVINEVSLVRIETRTIDVLTDSQANFRPPITTGTSATASSSSSGDELGATNGNQLRIQQDETAGHTQRTSETSILSSAEEQLSEPRQHPKLRKRCHKNTLGIQRSFARIITTRHSSVTSERSRRSSRRKLLPARAWHFADNSLAVVYGKIQQRLSSQHVARHESRMVRCSIRHACDWAAWPTRS